MDLHDGRDALDGDSQRRAAFRSSLAPCRIQQARRSPLDGDGRLTSQSTFSRLLGVLAAPSHLAELEAVFFDSAARRAHAMNDGQ